MASVIGRFEIVRELGKSDLGTVYKAYDPKKKRTVALRVLSNDTASARERARQYLLHAKAASVLDSPNIVSVYAGAEEQGLSYVVMEFVEGVLLSSALSGQQGFSSSELLDISRQVCRGLDHAHSKGVVHHRLTPAGILTEWDGTVKILDFAAELGAPENTTADDLRYFSPEQTQGRPPDARSNVFSWGAILYEMVTGRKAFTESDPEAVQREIMEVMPPAPDEVITGMPVGISRVIMKALAKNPEYRFQRAAELVSELEAECSAAGRTPLPGIAQVNTPPLAPAPRVQAVPVKVSALSTPRNTEIPAIVAREASAAALNSNHTEMLGYEVPASEAPAPPKSTAPMPPPMAVEHVSEAPAAKTIAARPKARRSWTDWFPAPLTYSQMKIMAGAVAAAVVVMAIVMVGDAMRARRMRAEAEAAAIAPLINKGAPDPITSEPAAPEHVQRAAAEPEVTIVHIAPRAKKAHQQKNVAAPASPAGGDLVVNSVPQGAQVQVDGSGAGLTPVALANLSPGQHTVLLSKPGYAAESRAILVHSGIKNALAVNMNPLLATASLASDPPGAAIIIDGHDTGKVTPAQLVVEKGSHSLVLRKAGYLETSASLALNAGETFQFQPTLKPLGNADDIKQVGKLKRLISHGGEENMARVQVHTFPKGAQIMFNSRMMDRNSPAEFLLAPGTYQVTLTLTGYKTVRKLITVESNGRMEVNETLER